MNRFERRYASGFGKGRKMRFKLPQILRLVKYITATLVAAVLILFLVGLLPIRAVTVEGARAYTEDLVASVGGIFEGDSFSKIRPRAAASQIREALPFVNKVKVSKKFFLKVGIEVEEYPQIYYFESEGIWYGINDGLAILARSTEKDDFTRLGGATVIIPQCSVVDGDVIFTLESGDIPERTKLMNDEEYAELYKATGDEKKGYIPMMLKEFSNSRFAGDITLVKLAEKYNISIVIGGRIKVIFGGPTDMQDKLLKAGMIYDKIANMDFTAAVIDVSDPSKPIWGEKSSLNYEYELEEETTSEEETSDENQPDEHGAVG